MRRSTASRCAALIMLLATSPWPSTASSVAGPGTDVRGLLSEENGTGTVTPRVFETRSRVTLAAGAALLARDSNAPGSVAVSVE
jgi:hypothetical protein